MTAARPIPFSTPMVRALLADQKLQTRRIIKPQSVTGSLEMTLGEGHPLSIYHRCPYGHPGDLLWVREAWRASSELDEYSGTMIANSCLNAGYRRPWAPMRYEADGTIVNGTGTSTGKFEPGRYRHARFMPRWASRLTLRVIDVGVERLQDISEADAIAEGIVPQLEGYALADTTHYAGTARESYASLWDAINGDGAWDRNEWVWALTFSVIRKNVDEVLAEEKAA